MIEDWIDTLTQVWEFVDPLNRQVRSYRLFQAEEFPEAIPIDAGPVALTIVNELQPEYGMAIGTVAIWQGVTEIHVTADLSKAHMPLLMRYYGLILKAAAANMTLGGKVHHFLIDAGAGGIQRTDLQYGAETRHWGFLVYWEVKEQMGSDKVPIG